jgi:heptosyltransferase-3
LVTWLKLKGQKFDYVFELGDGHRGRFLARISPARHRYSVRPATPLSRRAARFFTGFSSFDWETRHRVEKDFYSVAEFLPLAEPIPPLRFARERARHWLPAAELNRFAVVQIGKRQLAERWPREGWEEVGRWLLERLDGIVIASGSKAAEVEDARWLRERLGPRALATEGRAGWPQMAGLLYRARFYVGTDTATMHLAAACRCPAVALFGSTYEGHWRPWQSPHRIVADSEVLSGEGKAGLARAKRRSINGIGPQAVIAACEEFLREGRSG